MKELFDKTSFREIINANQIAIKEMGSQIELLKQRIDRLEDRNNDLVTRMVEMFNEKSDR
jgi:hypothetical protein